ncbi:MAG: tRNA (guanosine(46)-N7)-methyltransferase TrmB [Bacilli bacterium]|nr:tRNA (guanosine(46)-N7)-methyltransferase TrmB [Bacilli bacterium]
MRGRFKKWAAPYLDEHDGVVLKEIKTEDPYFQAEKIYLEVGSGKGDFVLGLSTKREGNFLALERDVSISGILAKKVVESEIKNIRVMNEDFDNVYEAINGKLKFDIIFLNFSDPWPKKKHWKRRLTTRVRLQNMMNILKDGGEIRIKTDNDDLYAFTKEEAETLPLVKIFDTDNYEFDDSDDAMSEYERNFRSIGKNINRLIYRK